MGEIEWLELTHSGHALGSPALSDVARKTCPRKSSVRGRACLYPPSQKHRPTWCFGYRILSLAIYPCTAFFLLARSSFPSYGRKFVHRGSTAVTEGEHRDEKSAIMRLLRLPSENRRTLEQKENETDVPVGSCYCSENRDVR